MKMTQAEVIAHQKKHGFLPSETPTPTLLPLVTSNDRIDFFMDFTPPEITHQQKGARIVQPTFGKPFISFFTKKEVAQAEAKIKTALAPFRPKQPFEGPLRLVMEWAWEWRKSEPKKNRIAGWSWRDTHPDADNLSKILGDQMQAMGFFTNDSQIADLRIVKQWSDRPGIRITLETLQNP